MKAEIRWTSYRYKPVEVEVVDLESAIRLVETWPVVGFFGRYVPHMKDIIFVTREIFRNEYPNYVLDSVEGYGALPCYDELIISRMKDGWRIEVYDDHRE